MNQAIHRLRLFFCTFSGEDDYIIRRCEARIQISFALIGLFVTLIFIGCWLSADLFLDHLFEHNEWMSAFVGLIWAMLVINLYLLLLYTISPALLPVANKKKNNKNKSKTKEKIKPESAFTASFIFRVSLIILLAIIIIQPFNFSLLSHLTKDPKKYANSLREILSTSPIAYYSWSITALGCTIFLLPIYWKYAIRNRGGFYEKKRHIETKFVHDNYTDFKEQYSAILNDKIIQYNRKTRENLMPVLNKLQKINPEKYNQLFENAKAETGVEPIVKYEYWADPPFRTKPKQQDRILFSEADFLHNIYSENT